MATMIGTELFGELVELARPLVARAFAAAPDFSFIAKDASPEMADRALKAQTMVVVTEAMLNALNADEFTTSIALGSACGAIFAQLQGDRRVAFKVFTAQMSRTLAEVTAQLEPKGNA